MHIHCCFYSVILTMPLSFCLLFLSAALSIELARDIAALKQQMAQQQSEHADALRTSQLATKSLESAQLIVSSELRRVTARVRACMLLFALKVMVCTAQTFC